MPLGTWGEGMTLITRLKGPALLIDIRSPLEISSCQWKKASQYKIEEFLHYSRSEIAPEGIRRNPSKTHPRLVALPWPHTARTRVKHLFCAKGRKLRLGLQKEVNELQLKKVSICLPRRCKSRTCIDTERN